MFNPTISIRDLYEDSSVDDTSDDEYFSSTEPYVDENSGNSHLHFYPEIKR